VQYQRFPLLAGSVVIPLFMKEGPMSPDSRHVETLFAGQSLLLCFSHLRWQFVYQRPQHLMSRAAADQSVIFFEEPVFEDEGELPRLRVSPQPCGVTVMVPVLKNGSSEAEQVAAQRHLVGRLWAQWPGTRLIWYYTPMALRFTADLQPDLCIYDCMDELSAFRNAPQPLVDLERSLLARADVVFTGGRSLFQAKRSRHPNCHLFPSSIEFDHFARARSSQCTQPPDQAGIPHPRVGFFGVVDERTDLELLAQLAARRPDLHLVCIGPVVKIDPATLPRPPNIHWLGFKSYAELPEYLSGWDAGFMPFALNEATRFISPTKTPEFLAAGVPVCSTPIADVVTPYGDNGLVEIAADAAQFSEKIDLLLKRDGGEWLRGVDAHLRDMSWDRTWSEMRALIESACRGAEPPQRSGRWAPTLRRRRTEPQMFDWLIVGAGFAGSVIAERLASQLGAKVLVVDKRNHVGGNAYDRYDEAGLLIHPYGPHIFHTNSARIFQYLSQFTAWRSYEHRVLSHVAGRLLPIPINRTTLNDLYGLNLSTEQEVERFLAERVEPIQPVRTAEDVVLSQVGRDLYQKFFSGYTLKQWGLSASQLDKSVTARVPVRTNTDDRYFSDTYQMMPAGGYTRMFERMLRHKNIKVMLQTQLRDIQDVIPFRRMVYTGPIDEFFDYRFGKLPYRSLRFEHVTLPKEWHQPVAVVNYPQDEPYTRVTEYKHLTGQSHAQTSLTFEYPADSGDPYYPVPRPENQERYKLYEQLANATPGVEFIGRLATYRYYNMDQVVGQALATFKRIAAQSSSASEPALDYEVEQAQALRRA
jgi:UDP-galactopyranose mutase